MELPNKLYRVDDGAELSLNKDDLYQFTESEMAKPWTYSYDFLMEGHPGKFSEVKPL